MEIPNNALLDSLRRYIDDAESSPATVNYELWESLSLSFGRDARINGDGGNRAREFSAVKLVSMLTFFAGVYRRHAINVVIMNKLALPRGANVSAKARLAKTLSLLFITGAPAHVVYLLSN